MKMIKKGDIVSRNSYKNDILFFVDKIIESNNRNKIAVLKGVTVRIEADSPLEDLSILGNRRQILKDESFETKKRINIPNMIYSNRRIRFGSILHLDGDKRYSQKTERYYRARNISCVVRHIAEYRQHQVIGELLQKYKPDIVVFTGHDGMIKNGKNYDDMNNYKNSKYFEKAVKEARLWNSNSSELIIFAGACQSYYEALISAGANFASSPARILIDFVDPLIVATEIATTDNNRIITMSDLERKIRNGRKAVSGIGACGKSL